MRFVKELGGTPSELRFDYTSPGAHIGKAENDRVELMGDGFALFIETDSEGRLNEPRSGGRR